MRGFGSTLSQHHPPDHENKKLGCDPILGRQRGHGAGQVRDPRPKQKRSPALAWHNRPGQSGARSTPFARPRSIENTRSGAQTLARDIFCHRTPTLGPAAPSSCPIPVPEQKSGPRIGAGAKAGHGTGQLAPPRLGCVREARRPRKDSASCDVGALAKRHVHSRDLESVISNAPFFRGPMVGGGVGIHCAALPPLAGPGRTGRRSGCQPGSGEGRGGRISPAADPGPRRVCVCWFPARPEFGRGLLGCSHH